MKALFIGEELLINFIEDIRKCLILFKVTIIMTMAKEMTLSNQSICVWVF